MILSSCGCKVSWALRGGTGGCGFCGSLGRGLQIVPTLQIPRRDRQHFRTPVAPVLPPTGRADFEKSALPSISKSADFSMGTGDALRGRTAMYQNDICGGVENCRTYCTVRTAVFASYFRTGVLPAPQCPQIHAPAFRRRRCCW